MKFLLTFFVSLQLLVCSSGCTNFSFNKNKYQQITWTKVPNYQIPQQVISFFYNNNQQQLITDLDKNNLVTENVTHQNYLTELLYIIEINGIKWHIKARDFKPPFVILNQTLYYTKTNFLLGKLKRPQDLEVFAFNLKTGVK